MEGYEVAIKNAMASTVLLKFFSYFIAFHYKTELARQFEYIVRVVSKQQSSLPNNKLRVFDALKAQM